MNEKPITTRYPLDLLAEVKRRAQQSGRSFNSEVIYELQQYQKNPMPTGSQTERQRHITEEDLQGTEPTIEEVWKRYATR